MAIEYVNFENNNRKLNEAESGMKHVLSKVGKANKYLNDLKNAVENGRLDGEPKDFEKAYITWFGALDNDRVVQVAKNVHDMLHQLTNSRITIHYLGDECEAGDYAYTDSSGHGSLNGVNVNLCAAYFTAPLLGSNSQTGTIIHELTHIIFDTDDHEYSQEDCKELARNNPARAIDNADNYEYFIESHPDK